MKLLAVALLPLLVATPKPPRVEYDAVRDVTAYSTDTLRINSATRVVFGFSFAGKTPVRPKVMRVVFIALRSDQHNHPLEWQNVNTLWFRPKGGKPIEVPVKFQVNRKEDAVIKAVIGDTIQEMVYGEMKLSEWQTLPAADEVLYEVGQTSGSLKGRGLTPLVKLDESIPAG